MIFYREQLSTESGPTKDKEVYRNESSIYYVSARTWDEINKYANLLTLSDVNTEGSLNRMLKKVIPKYGRNVYIMLVTIASNLPTGNYPLIEQVLDAAVIDNGLVVSALNILGTKAKEKDVYLKMEARIESVVESSSKNEIRVKELEEQLKHLQKENARLESELLNMRRRYRVKTTGKWRDIKTLPVLKRFPQLNRYINLNEGPNRKVVLERNIEINVPEGLEQKYCDFLVENYHLTLEFIAMKMPYLIPYIQRYIKMKER